MPVLGEVDELNSANAPNEQPAILVAHEMPLGRAFRDAHLGEATARRQRLTERRAEDAKGLALFAVEDGERGLVLAHEHNEARPANPTCVPGAATSPSTTGVRGGGEGSFGPMGPAGKLSSGGVSVATGSVSSGTSG